MLALALATLTQFTNDLPSAGILTIDDGTNDRYNLLTTILHETSHLAGFIEDHTTFDQ